MTHSFTTLTALKIYMKRGNSRRENKWWKRAFEKPLSTFLVREALRSGVLHPSVNHGHVGFTVNAKHVSFDHGESPMLTLPVCVELIAPRSVLEHFVRSQATYLHDTTLVMHDGVHISPRHFKAVHGEHDSRPD